MARYEHLPIFRKAFDLAVYLEKLIHGFSKHHKYGVGARLQQAAVALLEQVIRVQNTGGAARASLLETLRVEGEVLKNLLHLAHEVGAFKSFGAYNRSVEMSVEVGRQTEGWLKYEKSKSMKAPESRPTNPEGGRP